MIKHVCVQKKSTHLLIWSNHLRLHTPNPTLKLCWSRVLRWASRSTLDLEDAESLNLKNFEQKVQQLLLSLKRQDQNMWSQITFSGLWHVPNDSTKNRVGILLYLPEVSIHLLTLKKKTKKDLLVSENQACLSKILGAHSEWFLQCYSKSSIWVDIATSANQDVMHVQTHSCIILFFHRFVRVFVAISSC